MAKPLTQSHDGNRWEAQYCIANRRTRPPSRLWSVHVEPTRLSCPEKSPEGTSHEPPPHSADIHQRCGEELKHGLALGPSGHARCKRRSNAAELHHAYLPVWDSDQTWWRRWLVKPPPRRLAAQRLLRWVALASRGKPPELWSQNADRDPKGPTRPAVPWCTSRPPAESAVPDNTSQIDGVAAPVPSCKAQTHECPPDKGKIQEWILWWRERHTAAAGLQAYTEPLELHSPNSHRTSALMAGWPRQPNSLAPRAHSDNGCSVSPLPPVRPGAPIVPLHPAPMQPMRLCHPTMSPTGTSRDNQPHRADAHERHGEELASKLTYSPTGQLRHRRRRRGKAASCPHSRRVTTPQAMSGQHRHATGASSETPRNSDEHTGRQPQTKPGTENWTAQNWLNHPLTTAIVPASQNAHVKQFLWRYEEHWPNSAYLTWPGAKGNDPTRGCTYGGTTPTTQNSLVAQPVTQQPQKPRFRLGVEEAGPVQTCGGNVGVRWAGRTALTTTPSTNRVRENLSPDWVPNGDIT
ncbi:hypothetical protein BDV93DRAFT_555921 [Ceratobasidium sp. AG-I]|nr:hypothetical protein BDV93DRAFT_555921 [Ceratobasidium sp. AG-I]